MTYQEFQQINPDLTAKLASIIEQKLVEMGDDAKGISWFCSTAASHPKNIA